MKKTTKYILIALAVLVVLGGVLAVLFLTDPNNAEASEESSTVSEAVDTALVSREEAEISSIEVKNEYSQFTILSSTDEVTDGRAYTIEGLEAYSLKTSTLSAAAQMFYNLSYTKEIGESDNLEEFGLGSGAATATATYTDGSKLEIKIGVSGGESSGSYILLDNKVYITSVNTLYTTDVVNQVNNMSWSIADFSDDSGNTWSYLYSLKLRGTNFPREIEMSYNEQTADLTMLSPVYGEGNVSFQDTIITGLKSFSTSSVAKVNATAEDLEEYGLNEPYAEIEFDINGESHKITAGGRTDSYRYIYIDDNKDIVYLADNSTLSVWTDTTEDNYRSSYVRLVPIMDVESLKITIMDQVDTLEFTRTVNEDSSTDSNTVYDYEVTIGEESLVYSDVTSFYTKLIGLAVLNIQEIPYEETAEMTAVFNYYDGGSSTISYHKATDSEDRYVVLIDGEYSATVRKTSLETFYEAFETLKGTIA